MKLIKNLSSTLICVMLLFLGNCQKCKKDPIPVPDPCLGVKKANFKIYEQVLDSLFETDKALKNNFIVFQADEDYDSYEWKVGNDARTWTTKKFSLRFTEITIPLEVRLIAKRKPRPDCIPNDDGVDTIVKPFQVVPYTESKLLGEFQGFSKEGTPLAGNPADTFTVKIYQDPKTPIPSFVVDNFKKGFYPRYSNNNPAGVRGAVGYRAMKGEFSNTGFLSWKGSYYVNLSEDSIHIAGKYGEFSPQIKIEFKGKKTN